MFFDLSPLKILVLAVLGLVIFGPEQLPKMAAQAGQALRNLRRLAETARADLSDNLGADFRDFDFNDLNPRAFVRKHLFDEMADESPGHLGGPADTRQPDPVDVSVQLGPGEREMKPSVLPTGRPERIGRWPGREVGRIAMSGVTHVKLCPRERPALGVEHASAHFDGAVVLLARRRRDRPARCRPHRSRIHG